MPASLCAADADCRNMLETDDLGSCWNECPPFSVQQPTSSSPEDVFFIESFLETNLESLKCVKVDPNGVRLSCEMASQPPQSVLVENTALSSLLESSEPPPLTVENTLNTKCSLCNETYTSPKVLPCFHTFCLPCLEKSLETTTSDKFECPRCHQDCLLSSQGVAGLLCDYAISNILESSAVDGTPLHCTACKSKESNAISRCFDCANFLCSNCVMAHQFMHCFEGHRVMTLGELQNSSKDDLKAEKPVSCLRHKNELLRYFCKSCNVPICKECTLMDHPKGLHEYDYLKEVGAKQVGVIGQLIEEGKLKAVELRDTLKNIEHMATRLQVQYHKSQNEINETFQFYRSVLEERKQEALKELEGVYNSKHVSLGLLCQKVQEAIDRIFQTCEFMERLLKYASNTEVLMFKKALEAKIQNIINYSPEANLQNSYDIEFVSNYQAIQVGVRNTFGYIRSNSEVQPANKPQPIARPNGSNGGGCGGGGGNGCGSGVNGPPPPPPNGVIERPYQNGHLSSFETSILSKRFGSANSMGPFSTSLTDLNPYEKWSSGTSDAGGSGSSIFQNGGDHYHHLSSDPLIDLSNKLITSMGGGGSNSAPASFPPKSQIKRQKMIYHCKFGEFGVMEGQFTEPSGVAVNAQNDIIVADTNNHRIQIFDKEGRFKFQFGECGKRDGQLLYPNRVAVVKTSGDIIVTERSPTHQIQIYNQYGQFVRKFGANILQHPRGVTVDNKGRVVVVECKVMRVIIFDQMGTVLQKFGCSKHLEFPNGVVVNDKQEIFISDNRAHCVKVFNYEGTYLRQIGGEGITNYPIGVGINQAGEILIADNHNNFNLTIFTQDGTLVNALESKVKHAQCFDVALMDDGSVVLASKDYRLYIYRYLQVPSVGL